MNNINQPDASKNIAAWNDQPLDSWHDIVVSFDYARYNKLVPTTGGFAVVFFDSVVDMPRGGGPNYALGYNPSADTDYCKLGGYPGLEGAYLAVGFDSRGFFATSTSTVDGIVAPDINSFTVRGGVEDSYNFIYNSPDITTINNKLTGFYIDSKISTDSEIQYRSVRIILGKAATELRIQLKANETDTGYIDAGTITLPDNYRTAVKVAITNTTNEQFTQFKLKNLNVAGYPGETINRFLSGCRQDILLPDYSQGNMLPLSNEHFTTVTKGDLYNYTTNSTKFTLKNINYTGSDYEILGTKGTFTLAKIIGNNQLLIYNYLGEKSVKIYSITTPCGCEPMSADIDINNNIVVCTDALSGTVYFYKYISDVAYPELLGAWSLTQTINASSVLSGIGLGRSCSIYGNNLLVGNDNEFVHAFQKNTTESWQFLQSLASPVSGITKFGRTISLYDRDAIIGAPYSQKELFKNPGQGEIYHYYLYSESNTWSLVMALGSFYKIDSPGGNLGTSIKLNNNVLIAGSPGEMWNDGSKTYEDQPNIGRAYMFRKTDNGLFTQSTILWPESGIREPYMAFGQGVNSYNNYAAVLSPYNSYYNKSYVSIFNTECLYSLPPLHLPIPDCAYALFDGSGYVISDYDNTYMISASCLRYFTLTVQFSGTGTAYIFSSDGNISFINPLTANPYYEKTYLVFNNTSFILTASANSASDFIGLYSPICAGKGVSACNIIMTDNYTVTVYTSAK